MRSHKHLARAFVVIASTTDRVHHPRALATTDRVDHPRALGDDRPAPPPARAWRRPTATATALNTADARGAGG